MTPIGPQRHGEGIIKGHTNGSSEEYYCSHYCMCSIKLETFKTATIRRWFCSHPSLINVSDNMCNPISQEVNFK